MATAEEPDEETRLAERARRVWGENPFSPEAMAKEGQMKPPERAYIDTQRFRRLRDLRDEQEN